MFIITKQFLDHFAPAGPADDIIPVLLHKTKDFFLLWESLETVSGQLCDVPFWAVAWPAARALSTYIFQHPDMVKDKSILDLGCGCGIAGITASLKGGIVTLNDIDPLALQVASVNCALNNVPCIISNENLLQSDDNNYFDLIIIADCFYERSVSTQIMSFLLNQYEKGTEIIIADAHRPFAPRPMASLLHRVTLEVDFSIEGTTKREVALFKFQP